VPGANGSWAKLMDEVSLLVAPRLNCAAGQTCIEFRELAGKVQQSREALSNGLRPIRTD
jgi:hypothetical protein